MDAAAGLAWAGLALIVVYIPYTFLLLWLLPSAGGLLDSMARVVLIPGKRRTWFLVLSIEGGLFLLSGLTWALYTVGAIGTIGADWLSPLFFIGAVLALMGVQWIGLRPAPLTESERHQARASVPFIVDSLALAPFGASEVSEDERTRVARP